MPITPQQAQEELKRRAILELQKRGYGGDLSDRAQRLLDPDPYQKMAQQQGPWETAAIGAGQGLANIARGTGLMEQPKGPEKQAIEALKTERPYSFGAGELAGEAAPFLMAPVGAISSVPARIAAGTALGAVEGGLITRGKGGNISETVKGGSIGGTIAGVSEALLPHVGRLGYRLFRKVRGKEPLSPLITKQGMPSPEFQKALDESGVSFSDLTEEAAAQFKGKSGIPEQAAKVARFEEAGLPYTKGDISGADAAGGFAQQATEARLFESAADPMSDPLRNLRLEQSEGLKGNLNDLIKSTGMPEEIGESVKNALNSKKTLLRNQKNALYKKAAGASENIGGIPVFTDNIADSLPSVSDLKDIAVYKPAEVEYFRDLMAQYGIDKSGVAIKRMNDKGLSPEPLSVQNFERLRKSLGRMMDVAPGEPNHMAVIAGPIKDALDIEIDQLGESLSKSGIKTYRGKAIDTNKLEAELIKNEKQLEIIQARLAKEIKPEPDIDAMVQALTERKIPAMQQYGETPKEFNKRITDDYTRVFKGEPLVKGGGKPAGEILTDVNNKPITLWHGTNETFTDFDLSKTSDIGAHFGTKEQAEAISENVKPFNLSFKKINDEPIQDIFSNPDFTFAEQAEELYDAGLITHKQWVDHSNKKSSYLEELSEKAQLEEIETAENTEFWKKYKAETKSFWKEMGGLIKENGFDGIKYNNLIEGDGVSCLVLDSKNILPKTGKEPIMKGGAKPAAPEQINPQLAKLQTRNAELKDILEKSNADIQAKIPSEVLEPLKGARAAVRQMKKEFSPQSITGRLIATKKDGETPIIEASKVFNEIVGTNKPIEFLKRTVKSLRKAPDGEAALGNLQAATMFDLLEAGFKAQTRKVQGIKTFGPVAFNNRMRAIGDERLKLIFQTNPSGYHGLKKIQKLADDLTPPSGAVPKGSASVNADALISLMARIPGLNTLSKGIAGISGVVKMGGNKQEVLKALNSKPELKNIAGLLDGNFPSTAAALGIAGFMSQQEKDK